MEFAIVVRSVAVFLVMGWIAIQEVRRQDTRVTVLTLLFVLFGCWLWAETVTAQYATEANHRTQSAVRQRNEVQRMAARMLALEIYASYHATANEAEKALSNERLSQIAREEQMQWTPEPDAPSEPLPLRVRRLRRAVFELMPVWESNMELLEETSVWFSENDPITAAAFAHVLQNGGTLLLQLRLNWLRAVAIPAVRDHLVKIHDTGDTENRVVVVKLPSSLAIAPGGEPSIKLDVATLPHLQEEAARLESQLYSESVGID